MGNEYGDESVDKKSILIVDGSEDNRGTLMDILGPSYNYYEAENGADALALLDRYHEELNLVLLELNLEIVDGFDVLEWLKHQSWADKLPVIFMADRNTRLSKIEPAYNLGAIDNLMRPFSILNVRNRVNIILKLYEALENLAFKAEHDGVTGLLNEQAFQKAVEPLLFPFNAHRYILALINVDFFKRMINSNGHTFGDRVLMAVAQKLKDIWGEDALLARLGGDEFLAFLPVDYTLEETCDKLKQNLEIEAGGEKISISIGVADFEIGTNYEELLNRADRALFKAKADGRGCYRVYGK